MDDAARLARQPPLPPRASTDYALLMERPCSECGYDLSGLGVRGKCPECGQVFNLLSGEGIGGTGRGKADRSLDLAARLRTITFGVATASVLVCGGAGSYFATNPYRPIAIAGVFAGLLAMATVTSYLYEND